MPSVSARNIERQESKTMALDSTLRKPDAEPAAEYRQAPHNVEVEQALLGAILVNNEAFYRVSDFLEPKHFYEPIPCRPTPTSPA
jgi:replicative DNA helicase